MAHRHIQPSRLGIGIGVPNTQELPINGSATYALGAPVRLASNLLIEFIQGTSANILGFALGPATAGVPPIGTLGLVAKASAAQYFLSQVINGGAADVVVTGASLPAVGNRYGLKKTTAGWAVDINNTATPHVEIVARHPEINCVEFVVIETSRQEGEVTE